MTTPMHQQRLAHAFVELAGSAVTDPTGLLATLASFGPRLLDSYAATVLYVSDERTGPQLTGTDEELVRLERDATEWGEGPGHDACRTGRPVQSSALGDARAQHDWPRYAPRALDLGYRRAAALPLCDGAQANETLGALILLFAADAPLPADVLALAQSLTDATGFALARNRELRESQALADQLGQALTSRVVIEQAKGVLAASLSVSMDEAFAVLRGHARSHQRRLPDLAREVVAGRLSPEIFNPSGDRARQVRER